MFECQKHGWSHPKGSCPTCILLRRFVIDSSDAVQKEILQGAFDEFRCQMEALADSLLMSQKTAELAIVVANEYKAKYEKLLKETRANATEH